VEGRIRPGSDDAESVSGERLRELVRPDVECGTGNQDCRWRRRLAESVDAEVDVVPDSDGAIRRGGLLGLRGPVDGQAHLRKLAAPLFEPVNEAPNV